MQSLKLRKQRQRCDWSTTMAVGLLGCWAVGLLAIGLLSCWAFELLGYWAVGLLGCWWSRWLL